MSNDVLKWKKEDERNLRKAVSDFNKKVRTLNKSRKNASYLPSEIDYEGTKDLITTKAELNRVINSLGRFKGKEAFKKVTLKSGETLTNWEKREIEFQKRQAIRRINKRMAEIRSSRPEYYTKGMKRMGDEEYRRLESILQSIKDYGVKKIAPKSSPEKRKQKIEEAKARIENWGSADFEMRSAIIYRENYLSMLKDKFSGFENYDKLVEKVKSYSNPINFYKSLRNTEHGEELADISFMYDTNEVQKIFNELCKELNIDIEEEDFQAEAEEGE